MNFYGSTILITELLMLAMTLHVLNYSGFDKRQKIWYILTFGSIAICAAAEFAVHCGYYDERFAIPLTILTVIQFSLAPTLAMMFMGALGLPRQDKIAIGFFAVNFITQTVAAPFGGIFYFNKTGYFRNETGFLIYEVFYFLSLIYLIVGMAVVGKRFKRRDVRTIVMILIVLVAGIIPMTFFHVNVTYTAIAIGASLCYIYFNDLVQQDIKAELVANQKKMSEMQEHIISGLANLIEDRDMETGAHISRTGAYVKTLAEYARKDGVYTDEITDEFITLMCTLAPMHDIGKILISDSILRKPGRLTAEEYEEMKKHAAEGGTVVREVLSGITDEKYLTFASDIATYHHEKWNGTGYPKGLKGEDIPLSARIMAIADVFDALVSERCYKKPMPPEEAFKIIEEEKGTHFDPYLAQVFLDHKEAFLKTEK